MSDHRITTYIDSEHVHEIVIAHPALEGIAIRGFLLTDDRRSCIVIEAVPEPVD